MQQLVNEPDARLSKYLAAPSLNFKDAFHEFIKDEAVKIIRTDGSFSVGCILEQGYAKTLIENIFRYLLDGELDESLNQLEKLNDPPLICGKVFKSGEPTYSCRECAMDSTCVFCHKCFWSSEHAKHRYRMNASGGGGCCDCGDLEAWHTFPSCHIHTPATGMSESSEKALNLPIAIQEKAPYFFEVILRFVVELLTVDRTDLNDLPEYIQPSEDNTIFSTVLFNDESHTFDFVINVLKDALRCDAAMAADFATVVDREGRSVIHIGDKEKCEDVKKIVAVKPSSLFLYRNNEPLKTLVMHVNILALQELALEILPVFSKILTQSEGLRAIFCSVAMSRNIIRENILDSEVQPASAVEMLMRSDHHLWKTPRNLYLQLIMNSVLLNGDARKSLAILFTRLYDVIQDGFMEGDHDHMQSVASLSVQLFTVPSVARYLIEHENVIGVILHSLTKTFYKESRILDDKDWCRVVKIERKKMRITLRRMIYAFHDLRYILTATPTDWTVTLKAQFLRGLKYILQFMMSIHEMDGVVRRINTHIEHEPDWETGTTLMMRLYPTINSLLRWIASDTHLLFQALQLSFLSLKKLIECSQMKLINVNYDGSSYQCFDYDITTQIVSTHYPVTRFIAAILVELAKTGLTWQDVKSNPNISYLVKDGESIGLYLQEYSLRCLCLNGQVSSGMWKRNGHSLASQLVFYKDHRCRQEAFQRDIQMMQFCASIMDPDLFLVNLLNKMKVLTVPHSSEHFSSLMSETFTILIAIVGERYVPGVSDISELESIRRMIVHVLAAEAKPRSKIVKLLPDDISDKDEWEPVLQEIADFSEPTNANAIGKYSLKSEALNEFSPYSYQYSSATDETRAQQAMMKRKSIGDSPVLFIPPNCPKFSNLFSGVPLLLSSNTFVSMMSKFLQATVTSAAETWSDKVMARGVYLLAMAVNESKDQLLQNESSKFNFFEKSICGCENSVLFLLNQLKMMEVNNSNKDYIVWLTSEIEKETNLKRDAHGSSVDLPPIPNVPTKEENTGKNARKRKAQELRTKLLTQMKTMQQNFLSQNPELVDEESMSSQENSSTLQISTDLKYHTCMDLSAQVQAASCPDNVYTCMLCQEESGSSNQVMVMSALVQRSTVLAKGLHGELGADDISPLCIQLSFPNGIHASTCSHTMHYKCFKQFKRSAAGGEARRLRQRHRGLQDTTEHEFLCPLCSRLSNTVMPLISRKCVFKQRGIVGKDNDVSDFSGMEHFDKQPKSLDDWLKSHKILADRLAAELLSEVHSESMVVDTQGSDTAMKEDMSQIANSSVPSTDNNLFNHQGLPPAGLVDALDEFVNSALLASSAFGVTPTSEPLAMWLSVTTTIACAEKLIMLDNSSVLSKIPVRLSAALEGIIGTAYMMSVVTERERFSNISVYRRDLVNCACGEELYPAILNCDIFGVFIYLWFSTQTLPKTRLHLSDSISTEKQIVCLCTIAQLVQICVRLNIKEMESTVDDEIGNNAEIASCNSIRAMAGLPSLPDALSPACFSAFVKANMLPFLRCCVLFLSHVTGVTDIDESLRSGDEFSDLLKYLDLSQNLWEMLNPDSIFRETVKKWVTHPLLRESLSKTETDLLYPKLSEIPDIIPLPYNYGELVGSAASFKCPKFATDDSLHPTMCLVCGVMLCSQSYCCQRTHPERKQLVGACTFHARTCGAGSGLFLRVRESTIVLIDSNQRGTFINTPYLDKHGETDKGMRRGDPLYLNKSRLLELRKMWLSNGIAEKISYDTESRNLRYLLDWAHL